MSCLGPKLPRPSVFSDQASASLEEAMGRRYEAISTMAGQHGISERQARRYVKRAQEAGAIEVPARGVLLLEFD